MPLTRKAAAAGLLCATLALAGCSGGAGDLVGTWSGHDSDDTHDTLQIFDNGDANLKSGDEGSCQGKVDTDSEPYKLKFDCGIMKGIATLKLSGDGKSLDVSVGGSDTEKFTRVSDDASSSASPDDS
jgi:hypothetical protein